MSSEWPLDLAKRMWVRHRGPISIYGTWYFDGERNPQCLVLVRRGDELCEHCRPVVIPTDDCWIWAAKPGQEGYSDAAQLAAIAAMDLRFNIGDIHVANQIRSAIEDHVGDLLHIPPYVPDRTRLGTALGEFAMTARDFSHEIRKVIHSDEL